MSDNTIDGLKQRLVGAFVILSLAIIFLPMIFDKPHSVGSSSIVSVPPSPDVKPVVIRKPEKPAYTKIDIDPSDSKVKTVDKIASGNQEQKDAPKKVVPVSKSKELTSKNSAVSEEKPKVVQKTQVAKADSKKTTSKSSASTPKVSSLPVFKNVWMIQLGTFSNRENAYKLRDRLRKDGFDGHTKDIVIKGKKAVRVFTGPFVNKRTAEKTKKKVDSKYRVKSLILYFDA